MTPAESLRSGCQIGPKSPAACRLSVNNRDMQSLVCTVLDTVHALH